jgi:hypothetical protein
MEVRHALAEVRGGTSRLPMVDSSAGSPSDVPDAPPRRVRIAPTFYAGTSDIATATTLTLGPGEERGGIDFQLQYVPTATVSGTVTAPDGSDYHTAVQLMRMSETTAREGFRSSHTNDGRFRFAGVAPGRYMVVASGGQIETTSPAGARVARAGRSSSVWATAEIAVDGQDVTNVALTLQPGLTLSGRLAFEGSRVPQVAFSDLRIRVPASLTFSGMELPVPPLHMHEDGTFTVQGIIPGAYRFGGNIPGLRTPIGGWWLKSIVANGQELLDRPLELRDSVKDAVATLSDRASELSGKVAGATGAPVLDQFVVVFPVDTGSWFVNSRRIAGVRPGNDGRYSIRNLPAGEYFVAVTSDLEQGEWFDPSALQALVASAARIVIAEHETRTHDVTVR